MPNDIAIIILAAGGSSRLGKPKQLLPYKGTTTLLGHAIETALATVCKHILIITGAAHQQITAQIDKATITIIENKDWESGMASSIQMGINALKNTLNIKGALIMLCDQPLITTQHLDKLTEKFTDGSNVNITATGYSGIAGVPAIFPATIFPELLKLTGDEGAKHLISSHHGEVITVPFEEAFLDIDIITDHEKLICILAGNK